jgi:hypothetical protein
MSYIGNYPEIQQYTLVVDKFNGTGACTTFTLSRPIDDPVAIEVWVNSVPQTPYDSYSLSSTGVIVFTEAPSVGSNNIVVINRATTVYSTTMVGTADIQDGSITSAKIAEGTVIAADIMNNTVNSAKLTTTGVVSGSYGGASNVSTITIDTAGRVTYAGNVAIETGFNPFLLAGM